MIGEQKALDDLAFFDVLGFDAQRFRLDRYQNYQESLTNENLIGIYNDIATLYDHFFDGQIGSYVLCLADFVVHCLFINGCLNSYVK